MNTIPFVVERVGVAKSKNIPGMAVMFQRGRVKLSTKFRVFAARASPARAAFVCIPRALRLHSPA
jgi:hypothetical protein